MTRAGGREVVAPREKASQTGRMELLVGSLGALDGLLVRGEARRIGDDEVVEPTLGFEEPADVGGVRRVNVR